MDEYKLLRFKKLKGLLKPKIKAMSMIKASNDPDKFMKENKELSIKKLKGIAF